MSDCQRIAVIYSHPARQQNVTERPRYAHKMGIDVTFLTGLYFKPAEFPYSVVPWLPEKFKRPLLAQLAKRRIGDLPDRQVLSTTGPWVELLCRPKNASGLLNRIHDWCVSRWLRRNFRGKRAGSTIFHGFQGSCLRSINMAKALGMVTAVEITQPLATPREALHRSLCSGCLT